MSQNLKISREWGGRMCLRMKLLQSAAVNDTHVGSLGPPDLLTPSSHANYIQNRGSPVWFKRAAIRVSCRSLRRKPRKETFQGGLGQDGMHRKAETSKVLWSVPSTYGEGA